MRSARKVAVNALFALLSPALALAPVMVFARILHAEGPLVPLYAWTAVTAFIVHLVATVQNKRSFAAHAIRVLAAIAVLSGLTIILIQVNVARRSLAEAWLDLARKGEAFGFFSFFAAEIYAAFAIGQAALASLRRPGAFLAAAVASNALCAGIILGNGPLLALAVTATGALALALGTGPIRYRIATVSVPFAAATLLSALYALYSTPSGERIELPRAPDLSGLFAELAPDFPLLMDVPGYGFSVGSGTLPPSVFLSSRPLFLVQGTPDSTHYLADTRFTRWTGSAWGESDDPGAEIPLTDERPDSFLGALSLTLAEDFFPALPVEDATGKIYLPGGIPEGTTARRNTGARFTPSAKRGLQAYLLPAPRDPTAHSPTTGSNTYGSGAVGAAADQSPSPNPDPATLDATGNTPRMKALAQALLARAKGAAGANAGERAGNSAPKIADDTARAFVALLLAHFADGYAYSLDAGTAPTDADVNEWFVFEGKTGFCVYYASAFTMLAREAGIPSRMAEGYRVELDERGSAVISGNNAHAWSELWLDGAWRTFEPTPPFERDDPFAYTTEGDSQTWRQLSSLWGAPEEAKAETRDEGRNTRGWLIAGLSALFAALAFAAGYALTIRLSGERSRTVRLARRLVRQAAKRGVAVPETSGWLEWKSAAPKALGEKKGKMASVTAERMIGYAYRDGERL